MLRETIAFAQAIGGAGNSLIEIGASGNFVIFYSGGTQIAIDCRFTVD